MSWFYVIIIGIVLFVIWLKEAEYNLDAGYKEMDRKLKAKERRESKKREVEYTPEELKKDMELLKKLEELNEDEFVKRVTNIEKKILDKTISMDLVNDKHSRQYVSLKGQREKLIKERDELLKLIKF